MVLAYSVICLFAFFNLTYVRDFDAIQINATPMILSVMGILAIMTQFDICSLGMSVALVADGYFALRYKDNSDKIKYTPIELFAIESWTQQAFQKDGNILLQVFSATFIFVQLFLTLVGTVNREGLSYVFLAFYATRLMQFLFKTVLGAQMFQSNMSCVALAVIGLSTQVGQGPFVTAASIVMTADALLGSAIFTAVHRADIVHQVRLAKSLSCLGGYDKKQIQVELIDSRDGFVSV